MAARQSFATKSSQPAMAPDNSAGVVDVGPRPRIPHDVARAPANPWKPAGWKRHRHCRNYAAVDGIRPAFPCTRLLPRRRHRDRMSPPGESTGREGRPRDPVGCTRKRERASEFPSRCRAGRGADLCGSMAGPSRVPCAGRRPSFMSARSAGACIRAVNLCHRSRIWARWAMIVGYVAILHHGSMKLSGVAWRPIG